MIYTGKPSKVAIYVNTGRKTTAQVKAETGCTAMINGGLFNMSSFSPVCHLKADGEVLASDPYKYWGFGWTSGKADLQLVQNYKKLDNYICCVCLVRNGQPVELIYGSDLGGYRPRTAIGVYPDGRVWLYAEISPGHTPEQLQRLAMQEGLQHAIMLDGGGSTQSATDTDIVNGSRIVHNYICVWEDAKEDPDMAITINAYSKAKDGDTKLSTNFKVREFACKDGSDPIFIAPELVTVLQKIRTHFGKAVTVNSGYRTPGYNAKVGGATYSQHLYGTAADIVVAGVAPKTVAAYVEKLMPNKGGIGIYNTFVHVDVRATKSRWNG